MKIDKEYLEKIRQIREKVDDEILNKDLWNEYIALFPDKVFACCPLCKNEYRERINPYKLEDWRGSPDQCKYLIEEEGVTSKCEHFFRIQRFFNFERFRIGNFTLEDIGLSFDEWSFTMEQPNVAGLFLEGDFGCTAELRTWPMYAIRGDEAIHAYDGISIAYYAPVEAHNRMLKIMWEFVTADGYEDIPTFIWPWDGTTKYDHWWDLEFYRKKGLLHYDGEQFPDYFKKGRKRPYIWPFYESMNKKPNLFLRGIKRLLGFKI